MFEFEDLPLFTGAPARAPEQAPASQPEGRTDGLPIWKLIRPVTFYNTPTPSAGVLRTVGGIERASIDSPVSIVQQINADRVLIKNSAGWLAYAHTIDIEPI
jgi:hypothetical protein